MKDEEKCEHCKYWICNTNSGYYGRCENGREKLNDKGITTGIHMPWRFDQDFIPYAFGCVHFIKRGK